MANYKLIEGQCGTCKFAAGFDYADSPSGPESAVLCTSKAQAVMMDEQINPPDKNDELYNARQKELESTGSMNLWRLEELAEETYRCENWAPSDEWLAKKTPS